MSGFESEEPTVPFWRQEKSKGRGVKKGPGKYGIDLGERGIYDTRNKLNDLTGKEWTYFLNSVIIRAYPPTIRDGVGFDLRKIHPSPKPPQLMREIISFFTKGGQTVLDPFVGVGGTLLGASICDTPRHGVGIDLNQTYLDAYQQVCSKEGLSAETVICGDAAEVLANHPLLQEMEFDLILTDPPYADMMGKPKNGQKKRFYGKSDATPYSDDARDLGNMSYELFLEKLTETMGLAVSRLKKGKYLVMFCRDLQPKPEQPFLLHADIIRSLSTIDGLVYRGLKIWYDQAMDLYPFGYPYAFVMHQMHQYILIFRKEA